MYKKEDFYEKILSLIFSLALLLTVIPFSEVSVAAESVNYGKTITSIKIGSNEVMVFYPKPNAADSSKVNLTCTAPSYIVFGDGKMSKTKCIKYATENGLAKLAAENGASILFVQPSKDGKWSNNDAKVYDAIIQSMSDNSDTKFTNGISVGTSTMQICGSKERIYVYGIGTGADLIANNLLKEFKNAFEYNGKPVRQFKTMASATLEGLSNVKSLGKNDIPIVSINNSKAINKKLKAFNTNGLYMTATNRDFEIQASKMAGKYRREEGFLVEIPDYDAEGILEKVEAFTSDSIKAPINYVTYYSNDLDVNTSKKDIPLVLNFHGSGNSAKLQALASEWSLIARANNFILVSVDNHREIGAADIAQLVKHLEEEYMGIDISRIYASGFSMGSAKTWTLVEQYPELFAAVAPMHGSFDANILAKTSCIVPTFFVAGEDSILTELPIEQGNTVNNRIGMLFKVNQIADSYTFTKNTNLWGVKSDFTYQITDKKIFTNSVLTVELYKSKDGKCYTALASGSNQQHELFGRNSWAAWDFMKQFSRNADGTIMISSVTYALPSDDGKYTSNSYNE